MPGVCTLSLLHTVTVCRIVQGGQYFVVSCLSSSDPKGLVGVFFGATNKGGVFVADRVRSNQLPNLGVLYANEREERLSECPTSPLPAERVRFEARVETELKQVGIVPNK